MVSRITLRELAQRLNLAPSTVSRALQGHPDISKATRERVVALAAKLHYKPSAIASGLRQQHFHLLALILPDVYHDFYASVLHGVLECAYANQYKVMVFETHEDCAREAEICGLLQKSGVDGILIVPVCILQGTVHYEELRATGLPLVFIDRLAGRVQADRVLSNDYDSALGIVSHLIEQGCQRIAHLSVSMEWLGAQKRRTGYRDALARYHLPFREEWIVEFRHLSQVPELTEQLINRYQVDGVFAVNDESAVRAMAAIRKLNLKIPRDIAVAGFGNSPWSETACPSLTTVDRHGSRMGETAVALLLDRIGHTQLQPTRVKLLENELILRASSQRC